MYFSNDSKAWAIGVVKKSDYRESENEEEDKD